MSTSDYPAPASADRSCRACACSSASDRCPPMSGRLGAIVVLAAVIRIITIDNQSFWADEALTAYEAHLPFGAMLNTVAHVETTPPLYFVLIWFWAKLFGTGEVALRSISTIGRDRARPDRLPVGAGARVPLGRGDRGRVRRGQSVPDLVLAGGAGVHVAGGADGRRRSCGSPALGRDPSRRNI